MGVLSNFSLTYDSVLYNTSNLPFSEFCFIYFPDYLKILNETIGSSEVDLMERNCNQLIETAFFFQVWINRALLLVLSVGSALNILVLVLLFLSYPKNATDVYLISITAGDITICLASLISTQVPEEYGGAVTSASSEVLGNLGKLRDVRGRGGGGGA